MTEIPPPQVSLSLSVHQEEPRDVEANIDDNGDVESVGQHRGGGVHPVERVPVGRRDNSVRFAEGETHRACREITVLSRRRRSERLPAMQDYGIKVRWEPSAESHDEVQEHGKDPEIGVVPDEQGPGGRGYGGGVLHHHLLRALTENA